MKIIGKTKKELCIGQLLNGMIVVGEMPEKFESGEKIKNPIQIEIVADPEGRGLGFKSSIVGEQLISMKAVSIEGIPIIQTFELYPLPVELFISLHNCENILHGESYAQVYNELMTKMPEQIDPAKLAAARQQAENETKKLRIVEN